MIVCAYNFFGKQNAAHIQWMNCIFVLKYCTHTQYTCFPKPCRKSWDWKFKLASLQWIEQCIVDLILQYHYWIVFVRPMRCCTAQQRDDSRASSGSSPPDSTAAESMWSARGGSYQINGHRRPTTLGTSRVLFISKLSGNVSSEFLRSQYIGSRSEQLCTQIV